jgi:hypothetical protein
MYLPLARRRHPGPSPEVIGPQTQLVIDGYTRSATTFAVYAFQLSQRRPVRVAHHLHAASQLIAAARRGVPAIALIREPKETVLSQVIREPGVTVEDALLSYARFYACLMPYRPCLVVGEFVEVVENFGGVVARVNERFGTSFGVFESTRESRRAVLDLAAQRATRDPGWFHALLSFESGLIGRGELEAARARVRGPERFEPLESWVPSAARGRLKERLKERWADPRLDRSRAGAREIYERFTAPS